MVGVAVGVAIAIGVGVVVAVAVGVVVAVAVGVAIGVVVVVVVAVVVGVVVAVAVGVGEHLIMTNDEWIKAMRAGIPEEGEFPISSYDDLHPGRFLKCGHLKGEPRTLTVIRYKGEKMGMKNGRPQVQGIMSFKEIDKQYCTQKTNEALLRAMFGEDPAAVVGKRVTFRPGKTRGKGGGIVEAIRIAGSPDMTADEIEHTVEYAEKAMRKPETFTLTKTKLEGDKSKRPDTEPKPDKPPGDLEAALRTIATWTGDLTPLRQKLQTLTWTPPQRQQLKAALDAKSQPHAVTVEPDPPTP